jgi:transposase-like protein
VVQQYVPEFEKRWNHYARPVGDSWRVDETYIKVKGQWVYLYRAVDKRGRIVDFLLSKRRDVAAAKRFFSRAAKQHGAPRVSTLDGYAASHRAVDKLKTSGILPLRLPGTSTTVALGRSIWMDLTPCLLSIHPATCLRSNGKLPSI